MQLPEHIPAPELADAIAAVERAADRAAATLAYRRFWKRWERRIQGAGLRVLEVDRELASAFAFAWGNSLRLRRCGLSRPSAAKGVASAEETLAFLEAAEAERRAALVARAAHVIAGLSSVSRRGNYVRRRIEFLKVDCSRRGMSDREVRSWRAAFVDELARRCAPAPRPSACETNT